MKKTTLSINPNYPNQTTANSGRGGYPTNSPMKFAALSDIMNQSNANKFQSPMPTSNHQPAYTFNTIPQGPLISPSNLSSTSNITTNNPNAFNNTTNSASAAAKLSKLQARKEKQIILNNTINNRKDPSSFLNEELNEFKQSYNNNQNIISKEMEENYKIEKKGFFNRLQEENQLLLQLLEDIQESKASMMKRIKELEIAKDTLKALKTPTSLDTIDNYLVDECPLAESNRYDLNLSSNRLAEASKVYDRLVSTMTIFKSNYSTYFEQIIEQMNDITDLFLNNQTKEMNDNIQQLEQILILNPNNIEAVKLLSKSVEKSLVHATSDHLQDYLKKNLGKGVRPTNTSSTTPLPTSTTAAAPTNTNPSQLNKDSHLTTSSITITGADALNNVNTSEGYGESKDEIGKFSNEEIKQILAQNDQLRGTVAQLRQRLAQVRVNSVNSTSHSSLYGTPKQRGGNGPPAITRTSKDSTVMNTGVVPDDTYSPTSTSNNIVQSPTTKRQFTEENTLQSELLANSLPPYTTALPEAVQLLLLTRLKSYLNQMIVGNPAIPIITSNEVVKALIIEEVIQQLYIDLFKIFEITLKNKKELEFIVNDNNSNEKQKELINQEYLERDPQLVVTLSDCIDQVFQYTHVHAELLSWISLYCTYASARMGVTESVVLDETVTEYTENEMKQLHEAYQQQPSPHLTSNNVSTPTPVTAPTPTTESLRVPVATRAANLPRYMQTTKSFKLNLRSPSTPTMQERPFADK